MKVAEQGEGRALARTLSHKPKPQPHLGVKVARQTVFFLPGTPRSSTSCTSSRPWGAAGPSRVAGLRGSSTRTVKSREGSLTCEGLGFRVLGFQGSRV